MAADSSVRLWTILVGLGVTGAEVFGVVAVGFFLGTADVVAGGDSASLADFGTLGDFVVVLDCLTFTTTSDGSSLASAGITSSNWGATTGG